MTNPNTEPIRALLTTTRNELEQMIMLQLAGQLTVTVHTRQANGGCFDENKDVEMLLVDRIAELHLSCQILERIIWLETHPLTELELDELRKKVLADLDAEWEQVHPKSAFPVTLINPSRYRRTGLYRQLNGKSDPYEYVECVSFEDAVQRQKKHNSRKNKISVA